VPRLKLTNWLNRASWDSRQRAKNYKEHVVGGGWMDVRTQVIDDEITVETLINVPGFKRSTSLASIDVESPENEDWPMSIKPQYSGKSYRSKQFKWKRPAQEMITEILANPKKGLMLATFGSNGAKVLYDHVPKEVISFLNYEAESGRSLGAAFWQLVRYNKTRGGKYPYYYVKGGSREMTGEHREALDRKAYNALNEWENNKGVMDEKMKTLYEKLDAAYENDDYDKMDTLLNDPMFDSDMSVKRGGDEKGRREYGSGATKGRIANMINRGGK
jgi:hypothetical protein